MVGSLLGLLGMVGVLGITGSLGMMATNVQGQVAPVSMMDVTAGSLHLGSNPASIFKTATGYQVQLAVEVPFGLPELQRSWFQLGFARGAWRTGLRLSHSGFDQLKETEMAGSGARILSQKYAVGVRVGLQILQPGVLPKVYRPFWTIGLEAPLIGTLMASAAVQKEALAHQGIVSPTRLLVGGRVQIAPAAEGVVQAVISNARSLSMESLLRLRPVPWLSLDLGYETGRSMIFSGLFFTPRRMLASIHSSWHPVLGISTGFSLSWTSGGG